MKTDKKQNSSFNALLVISGLLITLYLTSNIMAVKVISIGKITLFDAGTITFPFAYMLGDVLTEIWGFKTARKVIFLTFFCNIVLVLMTTIGTFLPYPDYMQQTSEAYNYIFAYVPRIVIASLIGFLCGELTNSWSMEKIKALTQGKFLWLRTIGSSMIGYIFDTVLFVFIAYAGTAPLPDLWAMIGLQYIIKLLIEALCGTPMAYGAINWLKKRYATDDNCLS